MTRSLPAVVLVMRLSGEASDEPAAEGERVMYGRSAGAPAASGVLACSSVGTLQLDQGAEAPENPGHWERLSVSSR